MSLGLNASSLTSMGAKKGTVPLSGLLKQKLRPQTEGSSYAVLQIFQISQKRHAHNLTTANKYPAAARVPSDSYTTAYAVLQIFQISQKTHTHNLTTATNILLLREFLATATLLRQLVLYWEIYFADSQWWRQYCTQRWIPPESWLLSWTDRKAINGKKKKKKEKRYKPVWVPSSTIPADIIYSEYIIYLYYVILYTRYQVPGNIYQVYILYNIIPGIILYTRYLVIYIYINTYRI